jgi:hypothetical protein
VLWVLVATTTVADTLEQASVHGSSAEHISAEEQSSSSSIDRSAAARGCRQYR